MRSFSRFAVVAVVGFAAVGAPASHLRAASTAAAESTHPANAAERLAMAGAVVGKVSTEAAGLEQAKVYAYELASLSLRKVTTDERGDFRFEQLPSGLYKLIAFKAGFQPVMVMLSRTVAQAASGLAQVVDMEMAKAATTSGDDFWALRGRVPADVLRDLEVGDEPMAHRPTGAAPTALAAGGAADATLEIAELDRFGARMMALSGVSGSPSRPNETIQGQLDVDARLGTTSVDLQGRYTSLGETPGRGNGVRQGQATALSVRLENLDQGNLSVSALNHRMTLQRGARQSSAALDHYDIAWDRDFGSGRSSLRAEYTDEDRLFGRGAARSSEDADASRTLRLEGSYSEDFERHSLEAGMKYRQRDSYMVDQGILVPSFGSERVEVFGRGGYRVTPGIVLEYGLFSALQDGSLSLTPRGGVLLQLNPRWLASGSYSQRVDTDTHRERADFVPTLRERQDDFTTASTREFQVEVSRSLGEPDERLTLTAVHREFGDNLRVYFGNNLFDFIENVYLVPGDTLPELQLSVSRRLTPAILAKFESSYATGGGGHIAGQAGRSFENDVRYLLTSVDAHFLPTSTGVFLAFHRLEQDLLPVNVGRGTSSELESLELILTQDLSVLLDLAADWSLRFDVEFNRESDPSRPNAADVLNHRILGGLAIKF
jgi:hypothetical protein